MLSGRVLQRNQDVNLVRILGSNEGREDCRDDIANYDY
jgi:hypothetical protein